MLLRFPSKLVLPEQPPFELKGSLFTLTVLRLFQLDMAAIEQHLAEKIKQAPGFFDNTPVVIDWRADPAARWGRFQWPVRIAA